MDETIEEPKQSTWEKSAEEHLYSMLNEMGYTNQRIDGYQKKRVFETIAVFLTFLLFGYFLHSIFYVVAFGIGFYYYRSKYSSVLKNYQIWKFNRHLEFNKFTRLLIPYLMQSKGEVALYSIFNKILMRLESDVDRNSLYQLMSEMSTNPNDVNSFINYAKRSSGTDMSILFMSTIFDFQQSSFDIEVINELGKISSEELLSSIDDIIHMKLIRFDNFPTKITMASFVIFIGYAITIVLDLAATLFQ